jgi:hypothetical protein
MSNDAMHPPYWWCLEHERVEGRDGCSNSVRLGPFDDEADAAQALERARARTEAWEHDPQWNDDPDPQ